MRTTVDLSDAVFRKAKALAKKRRVPLRQLIEDGLRLVLRGTSDPQPYRLEDLSYGKGGLVDGLLPTDWERIRDRAYEGRGA